MLLKQSKRHKPCGEAALAFAAIQPLNATCVRPSNWQLLCLGPCPRGRVTASGSAQVRVEGEAASPGNDPALGGRNAVTKLHAVGRRSPDRITPELWNNEPLAARYTDRRSVFVSAIGSALERFVVS